MSFRKRNIVLSAGTSASPAQSLEGREPQQQQQRSTPATAFQAARGAAAAAPVRLPVRRAQGEARQNQQDSSFLPDPSGWTVASRVELPASSQAEVVPAKQRLRALLEKERQARNNNSSSIGRGQAQQPALAALGAGARPSPFDGRPITSTGTASLDPLLAGYGGLVLGHSLLVEEQGTTDFAGVLLRAYAAEGLIQGHHVHVLGFGHSWEAELPGLPAASSSPSSSSSSSSSSSKKQQQSSSSDAAADRMKIAWRYEALSARPGAVPPRTPAQGSAVTNTSTTAAAVFCHALDPSRRLASADIKGTLHPFPLPSPLLPSRQPELAHSPLAAFLASVRASLDATPPSAIHRVVLPAFLSPTLYAMDGWSFPYVISLLIGLRGILREHGRRLSVMLSLSTSLYERADYGVRQLERLCDNVVELVPLPPGPPSAVAPSKIKNNRNTTSNSSSEKAPADKMQGWFKVHKLQLYSETGGAGASPQGKALRENLCFSMSASRGLEISPYSLPPVDDGGPSEKPSASTVKEGIEF